MTVTKQKAIVLCGVLALAGVAAITVSLPFYSEALKERKEKQITAGGILSGGSKGSMWSNLDKEIKDSKSK